MSKYIVIGNWKMNPVSEAEAKKLFAGVMKVASKMRQTEVVVAPSFVHIPLLVTKSKKLTLGAQNVYVEEKGAFTGEVSALQLKNLGVTHVLVGHSERRAMGETSNTVNNKVTAVLRARMTPVVCIGEEIHDNHGNYLAFLQTEIKTALTGVTTKDLSNLIVAYEPIWAIGKNAKEAMNPNILHETVLYIQKVLAEIYGRNMVKKVRILYGGSVNKENIGALTEYGAVHGFLVGGASLSADIFGTLLKIVDGYKS